MYVKSINSLLLLLLLVLFVVYCNSLEDNVKVLSRKRRYLIFPEGSSLQISKFYIYFFNFQCD